MASVDDWSTAIVDVLARDGRMPLGVLEGRLPFGPWGYVTAPWIALGRLAKAGTVRLPHCTGHGDQHGAGCVVEVAG